MTLIEPRTSAELIAGDPDTLALRLTLIWQEDRFGHAIELIQSGKPMALFETIPDPSQDVWPNDPPLQQASIEPIDGRPAILGVGLAGTSHWSMSIETLVDDAIGLRLDCACRCSAKPDYLGSQYRWSDQVQSNTDAFAGLLFRAGNACVQIAPDDNHTVATTSIATRVCDIRPESLGTDAVQTIRWSYQIVLM